MVEQEHYLLSQRDDAEKNRLNFQSTLIENIRSNQVFEPSIATTKTSIRRIADIATGTGVWLEAAEADLNRSGNFDAEFVGFDISNAQFPKSPKENMKFVVCDINKGFAEELHGTFDIIHLRLLILVLTIDQIEPAVKKIIKLLKPGGFLQWTDLDILDNELRTYPTISPTLSVREEGESCLSFWKDQNWDKDFISAVSKVLQSCPMQDIQIKAYIDNCFSKPELQPMLLEWHRISLQTVLKIMMMREGKSGEEAEEFVNEYGKKVNEMGRMGMVFPIPISTLTARKI